MEVTNSLLVVMMFVVLLTIGIGNLIAFLANLLDKRTSLKVDALHTSWVVLLLLVYFNQFWQVLDILSIESWRFIEFLYVISGAVLIFFATHVLLPDAPSSDNGNLRVHYMDVSRQYFLFLLLLQVWAVGTDVMFGDGINRESVFSLIGAGLCGVLMLSTNEKLHLGGAVSFWLLFLVGITIRGWNV